MRRDVSGARAPAARGGAWERVGRRGCAAPGRGTPAPATCLPASPDVFLHLRLPAPLAADFAAAIAAKRRALEGLSASIPWDEPWPGPDGPPSLLAARTVSIRCPRGPPRGGGLGPPRGLAGRRDAPAGAAPRPPH